jgi:hypothetical protein
MSWRFSRLPQGRHLDLDHVDAIVEVLAEPLIAHHLLQVLVGRRQHPDVDFRLTGAADPAYSPLLKHPQQLHLHRRTGVADFVKKHRATVARLEQPLLGGDRAGKRSACMAEQLALEQLARHRPAIDRHERPLAPGAARMDRARQQLLAGTRFAADQHRAVGRRDALDDAHHLPHAGAVPDQVVGAALFLELSLEQPVLMFEAAFLQGITDDDLQLIDIERLDDVVVSSQLQRLDGALGRSVGGDHDHRRFGVGLLGLPQDLQSRLSRHRDIADDQIEIAALHELRGSLGRIGERHRIPFLFEHDGEEVPHPLLIIDDQEAVHCRSSNRSARTRRGRYTSICVPLPCRLCTRIRPPCSSTMR